MVLMDDDELHRVVHTLDGGWRYRMVYVDGDVLSMSAGSGWLACATDGG